MQTEINDLLFKLTNCQGLGNLGRLKILSFLLDKEVLGLTESEIILVAGINKYEPLFRQSWRRLTDSQERLLHLQHSHQFLSILDADFPPLLKRIYNCPTLLFYKGQPQLLTKPCLAVVGARQATAYGQKVVRTFVPSLCQKGLVIVSGLARGIDSCAHQAAILANGSTIGVIATGLDRCYPSESMELHNQMAQKQLLVSEHLNGTPPKKHHFPMRNRIIAGLSQGVCLVEARTNSGSLITAQSGLEYGRDVFVVPGNIFMPHSQGCHTLLYEGAKAVFSPQDILADLNFF